MSLEENKAIVRKMFEAIKDLAVFNEFVDEFVALDFVDRSSQKKLPHGREHWKQAYAMVLKDYPDLLETIEDIIAEGDKVWVLAKVTGTDSSGKKMDATALYICRIVNGKFVESWGPLFLQKNP